MDQNWYSQDVTPRPPKQPNYLWVWLLSGFVVFGGLIAAAVMFIAEQIPPGKQFGEWLAESSSTDNSQRVEFRNSTAADRLETARAAYAGNQLVSGDVTPQDVEGVRLLLQDLVAVFRTDKDEAFAAKTSLLEFRDKVRQARSLSLTAMRQFQLEFDDWFTMYSPYGSSTSRIELAAVARDPSDHTLIAYTWVFNSAYPERVAWYLKSNGQEMRIIDFEVLDTSALQSDETAREFSAAFTGRFWDNYLALHESTADAATTEDEIAAARADLARLSQLTFPKSVAHWACYRLALVALGLDDKDLCLQLLARTEEIAPIPGIYWQRAMIFAGLKDFAKATDNLRTYTEMIGAGPECFQLEAEIAVAQKEHAAANLAWINLLAMDPGTTSVPWSFHHHLTLAHGMALADAVRSRPDSAIAAQKIATLFVSRDRGDLAEALLPLAESVAEPTPGLLALQAKIAQFNGDEAGYIAKLERAWQTAAADDPDRAIWLYDWAKGLQQQGQGAKAIAKSPDPGTTFYDLAWDEDGELILNSRELQVLSDALQNASADEEQAQKRLTVWKNLAPVAVQVKRQNHPAVWQSLSHLFAADAATDQQKIVELLEDLEWSWIVKDWLADSAVRSGHAIDAWDLLPENGRLSNLLWRLEGSKTAETIAALSDRLRKDDPNHMDLIYCDAMIARLQQDFPAALQKYLAFLQHPHVEDSSFYYRARMDLVTMALTQPDWKPTIAELPNDVLLSSFVTRLEQSNRFADAEAVLEFVRQRGAPLSETINAEALLLHEQHNWPTLSKLCDQWLAARKAEDPATADKGYSSALMGSRFIDALLITDQLDRAEEVVAQLPNAWMAGTWKLRIAVARNDQAAAEAVYAAAVADSSSLPDVSQLGTTAAEYWSDGWKDFRNRHPMDFYDMNPPSGAASNTLILQSAPSPLNAIDLQTRLQELNQDAKVTDLTESLIQIEQLASAQLPAAASESLGSTNSSAGTRHLFRITLEDCSFLIRTGSDSYHDPASNQPELSNAELLDSIDLTEPLRQAIGSHRGWISLRVESNLRSDADRVNELHAEITAALLNDSASVVSVNGNTALVSPEVIAVLTAGLKSSIPGTESYSPTAVEPLLSSLDLHSSARLRALRKRLSEIPPGDPVPPIRLLLSIPGVWQRDRTLIECPLLQYAPQAFPTSFTINFGDSPFVAPCFRGEPASASAWSVVGWREE